MKRHLPSLKSNYSGIMSIMLFIVLSGIFFAESAMGANATSQHQLTTVNNKIMTLKKNLSLKTSQRDQLEDTLKKLNQQIVTVTKELDALNLHVMEKEKALSASKVQWAFLEKASNQQREVLGKQLRASYQLGRYEYMHLLLNQQDPSTMLRMMAYYNYINKARMETLAHIQETEEKIQKEQQIILTQKEQLTTLTEQQQTKKMLLEKTRMQQQQVMMKLNQEIRLQSKQLKMYETDKQFLEALIHRLEHSTNTEKTQTAISTMPVESSAPMIYKIKIGAFHQEVHHLIWPTRGKLLNKATVPVMQHQPGIVILAPEGQSVVSVFPGKVVFSGALKGFGLLMIIDHGQGYMTLYAHNQALYRKRGERVNAGDLIAYVGHTGILPESGLYFEIRHWGRPLNPLQWLTKKT